VVGFNDISEMISPEDGKDGMKEEGVSKALLSQVDEHLKMALELLKKEAVEEPEELLYDRLMAMGPKEEKMEDEPKGKMSLAIALLKKGKPGDEE